PPTLILETGARALRGCPEGQLLGYAAEETRYTVSDEVLLPNVSEQDLTGAEAGRQRLYVPLRAPALPAQLCFLRGGLGGGRRGPLRFRCPLRLKYGWRVRARPGSL